MRRPTPLPSALQSHPFTVATAAALGVTRRRTRATDLAAPFRGVRTTANTDDVVALCRAYAARMPESQYFSHETAARLWGIPLPRSLESKVVLHVSAAPGTREPRMRGVIGHRGPADAPLARVGSLRLSTVCDTWCHIVSVLTQDEAIVAGDRIIGWPVPLGTLDELDAAIARYGSRRGARAIARARTELLPGSASPRETRLRLLVARAGYPRPELNGAILLTTGRTTHGDLVFRRYRVLLE